MTPGSPIPSLLLATKMRLERQGKASPDYPHAAILSYDKDKGAAITARIEPLLEKFKADLSSDQRELILSEAKRIVVDANGMATVIRDTILIGLFNGLSRELSLIGHATTDAHALYHLIDELSRMADESAELSSSGINHGIDISKEGLESPDMLAAVWLHRRLHGVKRNVGRLVKADVVLGSMAFEDGQMLDGLCRALRNLDANVPIAELGRLFGNPRMEQSLLLVLWDFVDRVMKLGGLTYLIGKGFDLSIVFDSILAVPAKKTMAASLKVLRFLLALTDHQHSVGELNDDKRSVSYGRILQSALIKLNNKGVGKHKGWREFVENLAPYAPAYLTVGQFIGLGRAVPIDQNPLWGGPLSTFLERGKFRKGVNKTVNPECRIKVIKNLQLEAFYTKVELFEMSGKRGILMETVHCLDVSPENENPRLQVAIKAAQCLIDSHTKHSSAAYELAIAAFLPFMSRNLGEMPLIIMAKVACFDLPDQVVQWPENLENKLNHTDFKVALRTLIEPEQRYQVVNKLRLECMYSRQDILRMKGERLSVDLGL